MSAGSVCWECGQQVSDDELEQRDDGRLLCCCCRLKEDEEELAEKELVVLPPEQDRGQTECLPEVHVSARRDAPPPESDSSTWISPY